jgi:DNA polymerase-3 subunit beta
MLTAVNLELAGGQLTLAATDRYRLAVRELAWKPGPQWAGQDASAFLVPARTLIDAARMMSPGTEVRLMFRNRGMASGTAADAMIGFEAGPRRLTTRLLAGEFVRYRSRFPADFGCTADLPAEAFADAVRRVALVAERGTPVQLAFAPGRVTIGAGTQGTARATESLSADFAGDEPVIAFNPHYLLDGIIAASRADRAGSGTAADGVPAEDSGPALTATADSAGAPDGVAAAGTADVQVRLSFSSPTKPAVLTRRPDAGSEVRDKGAGFRYLVVPQRVSG